MHDAHQLGTLREEFLVFIQKQLALVVHGDYLNGNALLGGLQLPGNDVAMVLHGGDDDLIARLHLTFGKRRGQKVDAFGRTTGKDDFGRATGVDETAHRLARSLVKFRGLLGKEMHSAMHIGIHGIVFVGDGFHYTSGFLCGSSIVQIDQRLAIHFPTENGEIFSDFIDIVHNNEE